ncbi:MAG: RHS repeat protein, partial [Deltaproteobacteria bacterium]
MLQREWQWLISFALVHELSGCTGCMDREPPEPAVTTTTTSTIGGVNTNTPSHACPATAANAGAPQPWQGGDASFNPCTGNLQLTVSFDPLDHVLVWNSLTTADVGFGYGWTASFFSTIAANGSNLIVTLGDGTQKTYVPTGGGNYAPSDPQDTSTIATSGSSYVLKRLGGEQFTYANPNATGYVLTRHADRLGNADTITFNASNQPTTLVDQRGLTTTFGWTGGHLSSLTDPDGRVHALTYVSNELRTVQHPAVAAGTPSDQFAYDSGGRHLIVGTTDPAGASSNINYNADRTWDSATTADSRTQRVDYFAGQTKITDGVGNTTSFNYTGGALVAMTEPSGQQWQYTRDARQRTTRSVDPYGRTELFAYDANDNTTSYTNPMNLTTTMTYDANHNMLTSTPWTGKTETYTYNQFNQVATWRDALGHTTTYNRNASNGNLTSVVDYAGTTLASYTYNAKNFLATETDKYGLATSYAYNAQWNLTSVTQAGPITTSRTATALGLTSSVTDP